MNRSLKIPAIVAAATVGDGVFALPFIFLNAGWLLSIIYLATLAIFVITAHVVYLKTLEKVGEKKRLLGLARTYLGRSGFWTGFLAIVIGLLLTLVAYLILGVKFIGLALPGVSAQAAFIVFWLLISWPVFLDDSHVVDLELLGISCTSVIIFIIFFSAFPQVTFTGVPAVNWNNLFLPFGAILFSLAGWTSIEPAYESRKREGRWPEPWRALAGGTLFAALLYIMFAAGIIGSAPNITADTASGLFAWPFWKRELLAILGLIAVSTVYLPISREIKNSLEKDLRWNKIIARLLIVFAPPFLIWLGLDNFLVVVGLVGGIFLSLQYLLIISVGRHALKLSAMKKFFLDLVVFVFVLAAIYSAYSFVVH